MHIFGHTWLKIYQFVVKPGSACKNFILIHPFIPASYYQTKYSKICWPHQILTKPKLVSACRETSWLVNIAILTILQHACPFLEYHLPKNYQIIIFLWIIGIHAQKNQVNSFWRLSSSVWNLSVLNFMQWNWNQIEICTD